MSARLFLSIIGCRLGIAPWRITAAQVAAWDRGWLDQGACCERRPTATAPAISASGPYTIAWCDWPNPAPTDLITQGGDE
jgi:hypothetical protein